MSHIGSRFLQVTVWSQCPQNIAPCKFPMPSKPMYHIEQSRIIFSTHLYLLHVDLFED